MFPEMLDEFSVSDFQKNELIEMKEYVDDVEGVDVNKDNEEVDDNEYDNVCLDRVAVVMLSRARAPSTSISIALSCVFGLISNATS